MGEIEHELLEREARPMTPGWTGESPALVQMAALVGTTVLVAVIFAVVLVAYYLA